MKIAVLSESTADEAAVSVLVEGLVGTTVEWIRFPEPSTRGWKGVFKSIEPVLRHLHYRTDAEAIVLAIDSDESPVHRREHDKPGSGDAKCRLCQLRLDVGRIQAGLRPRQGRAAIRVGLGIAVPAIEAWFVCGSDPHVTESTWIQALQSRRFPYTKKGLKQRLYGSDEPPLELETGCLTKEARRLLAEGRLPALEMHFPIGFGVLAKTVRSWLA